ncbi:MAG: hypothetical protein WCK35_02135 [Chloroflexota bacterium]
MFKRILLTSLFILTACTPTPAAPPPVNTPQVLKIHASAAAQPWLFEAFDCADKLHIFLFDTNDPEAAEINIRIGEPDQLTAPAFQIDQEDLLVVTHRENPLQNLTAEEVRLLFSNPNAEIQTWVYALSEDVQQVFAKIMMKGQGITSLARIAGTPQQMSDIINQDKNAVGLLPVHWKAGTMRVIFTIPGIPVLAITKSKPAGQTQALLECLQK